MVRRRILFALIVMVLAVSSLAAAPRFFAGVSFNYDVNYLAPSLLDKFTSVSDSSVYNGGDIEGLQAVGPKLDFVVFPFSGIPLGFGINTATMFNIGYMTGGEAKGYFSRKIDLRQDIGGGVYYQQAFNSTWGLFIDCGLQYSWYRISTSNDANSKEPVSYIRFTDWGLLADLGVYLEHNGAFFKVGGNFYYDLGNTETFAFRYGMTVGGGIAFG